MEMNESKLALRLRRLKLLHFEVVIAVAESGSLTAAAAALGRSQPAVSQQLAEAEDALGVQLFSRGRQIKATVYLPAVLQYMRRSINDSWQLGNELETISQSGRNLLRIGTMPVTATVLVPNTIIYLREQGELIQLEVVEDIAAGLWARFERNEIDLIVGRLDERAYAKGVSAEAIFEDPHCIVVNKAHPLLKRKHLQWENTKNHPWVMPPRDTVLRRAVDATFLDLGLSPPVPWVESASPTVNLGLTAKTDCLTVISRSAVSQYIRFNAYSILPLRLKYEVGPIGMAWATNRLDPTLNTVVASLRVVADQINPNFKTDSA